MIRMSEAVLPGHPDKFCDAVAEAIVAECYRADERAYCQVEVSTWCDEVWVNGGTATRKPLARSIEEIVREVGREVGYVEPNPLAIDRCRIRDSVCQEVRDPREWTDHVNDQCIAIGWAGYDEKVGFLPPEHFLVHWFRRELWASIKGGRLQGQGPDGKILVRVRENEGDWRLEHLPMLEANMQMLDYGVVGFALIIIWKLLDIGKHLFLNKKGLAPSIPVDFNIHTPHCKYDPLYAKRVEYLEKSINNMDLLIAEGRFDCQWKGRDEIRDLLEIMRGLATATENNTNEVKALANELRKNRRINGG